MPRGDDVGACPPPPDVDPRFGPGLQGPRTCRGVVHGSPSSSDDEAALDEWRRACASASRKRPISDTLAHGPLGGDSPPGYLSEPEPELGQAWQEGALSAFPSVRDPAPARGALAPAIREDQWRPALEAGTAPNHGWCGLYNPPPGSAGLGRALPAYSPEDAAVFVTDVHAMEDIGAGFAARKLYKPPSLPRKSFSSSEQRDEASRQIAINELLPMLPGVAVDKLLHGASTDSLTREEATRAIVAGMLHKAGPAGANVLDVVKTLHFLNGYAASRQKWFPTFTLWPMSAAVAATIIQGEHSRATLAGRGSTGGQTCGDRLRRTLTFMSSHLGFPISTDAGMVAAAAPSQREVRRPPRE